MKYFIILAFLFTISSSAISQRETDIKLKAFSPLLEGSVALQVERSISPHLSILAGVGYNDTQRFNELSQIVNDVVEYSGILGEIGMRYYHRPYFHMDQLFSLIMIKLQGPSELSESRSTVGAAFGIGAKHVFTSRIIVETYIGYTFNSASSGSLRSNRSSAPLLLWGLNVGYRLNGNTLKGTAAHHQKKSRSKKRRRKK